MVRFMLSDHPNDPAVDGVLGIAGARGAGIRGQRPFASSPVTWAKT